MRLILSRHPGCALRVDGFFLVLRHVAIGLWEEKGAIISAEMAQGLAALTCPELTPCPVTPTWHNSVTKAALSY